VHAAQEASSGRSCGTWRTLVLGVVFLVIKYFEYSAKFELHHAHTQTP